MLEYRQQLWSKSLFETKLHIQYAQFNAKFKNITAEKMCSILQEQNKEKTVCIYQKY